MNGWRGAAMLAVVLSVAARPAQADFRYWQRVCGGNEFVTCASVHLDINHVTKQATLRVWNLSGVNGLVSAPPAGWQNSVITTLGFYNTGGVRPDSSFALSMAGPTSGGSAKAWSLRPSYSPPTGKKTVGSWGNNATVAGISLDLAGTTPSGVNSSIASACRDAAPVGSGPMWLNPCSLDDTDQNTGWIVMNFKYTGTWNLSQTGLALHAQSGVNGGSTNCWTVDAGSNKPANCFPTEIPVVAPEPVTILLLGSGMIGMGGVGFLRRRREQQATEDV